MSSADNLDKRGLGYFRHQANPRTLSEANVIADALATLLEEVLAAGEPDPDA